MSTDKTTTIVDQYRARRELYQQFAERLGALLRDLLTQNSIQFHTVASRAKDAESLRRKLLRKPGYATLEEITDLAGVRVITYFAEDVDRAAAVIECEFEIDREHTVDRRVTLDPDRFGYLSMHHVVRLDQARRQLTEYQRFPEMRAEIQTRSVLQHAWAEIEHDLGYKGGSEVPRHIRRRFSRIASLLELADQEFGVIRAELSNYEARVESEIQRDPDAVSIDKASITAFATTDPLVARVDAAIAALQEQQELGPYDSPENDVRRLTWLGLQSIGEIRSYLKRYERYIVGFAAEWLQLPHDVTDRKRFFQQGISLFYLGYVMLAARGDRVRSEAYLENMSISSHERHQELASKMEEIYEALRDRGSA